MKSLSSIYKESLIGKQVNTLATCFKVELRDGRKLGFTTHTRDITFVDEPTLIYRTAGFTPTASSKSSQMNVDNMDVDLIIDHENIKPDDLEKGVWNNAKVFIFQINWAIRPYIYANIDKTVDGTIGEISRGKQQFKTEFRSKAQYLQNNIVDVTKGSCNAKFGDSRCKKNVADYTVVDTVQAVINNRVLIANTLTNPDGWFNGGIIEFTTGQCAGKKMEVKLWTVADRKVELVLPMNYIFAVNDEFKILAGCDHNKPTCITKFNNIVNFRGFSFIPGIDKATGGNQP